MRPQRFSCGIQKAAQSVTAIRSRFNEAAAFQLRNQLVGILKRIRVRSRFNEAAAFQLRNQLLDTHIHRRAFRASMRPQRFSCGIAAPEITSKCQHDSFNEAAAFQLRNRVASEQLV